MYMNKVNSSWFSRVTLAQPANPACAAILDFRLDFKVNCWDIPRNLILILQDILVCKLYHGIRKVFVSAPSTRIDSWCFLFLQLVPGRFTLCVHLQVHPGNLAWQCEPNIQPYLSARDPIPLLCPGTPGLSNRHAAKRASDGSGCRAVNAKFSGGWEICWSIQWESYACLAER